MLAEYIMFKMGWTEVWLPGASGREPSLPGAGQLFEEGTAVVGMWTGPDDDLLCVKRHDHDVEQARRWCSPPGRTILDACLRGLIVYAANSVVDWLWRTGDDSDALPQRAYSPAAAAAWHSQHVTRPFSGSPEPPSDARTG